MEVLEILEPSWDHISVPKVGCSVSLGEQSDLGTRKAWVNGHRFPLRLCCRFTPVCDLEVSCICVGHTVFPWRGLVECHLRQHQESLIMIINNENNLSISYQSSSDFLTYFVPRRCCYMSPTCPRRKPDVRSYEPPGHPKFWRGREVHPVWTSVAAQRKMTTRLQRREAQRSEWKKGGDSQGWCLGNLMEIYGTSGILVDPLMEMLVFLSPELEALTTMFGLHEKDTSNWTIWSFHLGPKMMI